jgi:archaellum component FlaF (FlaF/FlaG flagellin family)
MLNPVDNTWHSLDIEPGAIGVIELGDKNIYQGFVINYIMKMSTDIQYGNISVIHNGTTVSDPPFNEFYFVENEASVTINSDFNGNMVEIDLQNNDLTNHATFKYRIIEKIDLI